MDIKVNLTDVSTEINSMSYVYDLFVDGEFVKFDSITRATFSDEWLINYFQKWAYRTYKTETATIVLSFVEFEAA